MPNEKLYKFYEKNNLQFLKFCKKFESPNFVKFMPAVFKIKITCVENFREF